jgi:hypothetical protein
MFGKRRPTERALLLSDYDAVLRELRPLCGALLLGKRRGTHPAYETWLEASETAMAIVTALRDEIRHDQQLGAER